MVKVQSTIQAASETIENLQSWPEIRTAITAKELKRGGLKSSEKWRRVVEWEIQHDSEDQESTVIRNVAKYSANQTA